jgi:hypothetical protein
MPNLNWVNEGYLEHAPKIIRDDLIFGLPEPGNKMNRAEKGILKTTIKAVIEHNSNLWWELKRQIFDMGYQTWYPMQEEYRNPVEAVFAQLEPLKRAQLIAEWRRCKRDKVSYTDDEIMRRYVLMVIEEVVERARSAARRTIGW